MPDEGEGKEAGWEGAGCGVVVFPNPSRRRGLGNGGGWGRDGGWGQGDGGGGGGTAVDEPSVDEMRAQDVGEGGGRLAAGGSWRGKERERKGQERRR